MNPAEGGGGTWELIPDTPATMMGRRAPTAWVWFPYRHLVQPQRTVLSPFPIQRVQKAAEAGN